MAAENKKKQQDYQPPRHVTPPREITPPSGQRERVLPLHDVGSRKFEELCCDLLKKAYPDAVRASLKRKNGQAQYGVDVEGFDTQGWPAIVISSKCYADIVGGDIRPWVKDFTKHLSNHWKGKNVKRFVLAVTHECNDDKINEAAQLASAELERHGIQFDLWNSLKICELLRDDPKLVNQYFNRFWVEAISADLAVGHPSVESNAPLGAQNWFAVSLQQAALGQIDFLTGQLKAALSKKLDDAVKDLREGRHSTILNWMKEARADPALWTGIDTDIRAKAVRAAAMAALREGDIPEAAGLLDEADGLAPATDRTVRTIMLRVQAGLDVAITYIDDPSSVREREIKAALLIERQDVTEALCVLEPIIGDEVTAEVLRLRAIAYFISGDREKALNYAASSARKGKDDASPRFTLACMRFACALAEGTSGQFAGTPDPVSRSLVRRGADAVRMLAQAAQGFDELLSQVEGELHRDMEVWKLASLLLNPDTQAEARRYARVLLAREAPEPVVVAWCLHFGLPMRRGRIKKVLGDTLRRGNGTPSHVVVLALMAAKMENPRPGLAILNRFGPLFPDAVDFFGTWRGQFGEDAGPVEKNYSAAVRWTMSSGDSAPLLSFLRSSEASVENVISGAEFLASRRLYKDVDALRSQLIVINTDRAIELAAYAACKAGSHQDCLSILNGLHTDRLPTRLIYLRIEAHEALGSHRQVISDLKQILAERDDAGLHDRLINAYLRIGALEEAKEEAERALSNRTLDSRRAVQIAYALKKLSPDTARRALGQLKEGGIPSELSGVLVTLSHELGMLGLQDAMMRRLGSGPGSPSVVMKFDSVEDVLSFLRTQADEYRKGFAEWLSGKVPAAVAMRSDLKAFGLLFLGGPEIRKNNLGDPFPMLLLGLGQRQPPGDQSHRPELMLDLSALLLAHRLGLLDRLDLAFRVLVPPSLPEALVELAAQYSSVSPQVAEAINSVGRGYSAIRVIDTHPLGAMPIDDPDIPGRFRPQIVAAALDYAFRAGHLTRADFDRVSTQLQIQGETLSDLPKEGLVLSLGAMTQLARTEILEPLARSQPIFLLRADMIKATKDLAVAEAEWQVGELVEKLRRIVAERLSASQWRTAVRDLAEEADERVAGLPAHVRCLLETLPGTEQELNGSFYWIEDRTFSKRRLANALYLPDILQTLVHQNIVSAAEYTSFISVLQAAGYSYAPIDVGHIVSLVEQAAVSDGVLVENPDIVGVRRWFATEVANLMNIDPTMHLDADGMIVGETRRTIELGTVVKEVLAKIWARPDIALDQKIARASWAWMALRLEYVPSPPALNSPSTRRQYAALVCAQVLALPLHAELGSIELPTEHRPAYTNWAVQLVGEIMRADADFRDDIFMLVAGMVDRILEDPADIEEDLMEQIRSHLRSIVHNYLSLLPDDWYDEIAERKGIGERLQRYKVTTLEVSDAIQICVPDLVTAIETARNNDGPATVPLHRGTGTAQLKLTEDSDGRPGAVLVVENREWPLHPSTFALVHPDQEVRSQLVDRLQDDANGDQCLTPDLAQSLLAEPNVETRVNGYLKARAGEFRRSLEVLGERVQAGRPIRLADVDLPAPGVLLEYLGLPPDFSGDYAHIIDQSSLSLTKNIGVQAAVERLASLPFRLPESLLESYSTTAGDWQQPCTSALLGLVRIKAIAKIGIEQTQAVNGIAELLENEGKIFSALVRNNARQAARDPAWSALPFDTVACLIWLSADQHCRMLSAADLNATDFSQWLSRGNPLRLHDLERQNNWPRWARSYSMEIHAARLYAAIAAELLRHGIEVPQQLKMLIGSDAKEAWLPHPMVLGAAIEAPAGFWPADDPVQTFVSVGWLPNDDRFTARTDDEVVCQLMRDTAGGSDQVLAPAVMLMAEVDNVDGEVLADLRKKIDELLAQSSSDWPEAARDALLDVAAKIYGKQNDTPAFNSAINRRATANARMWPHRRLKLLHDDDEAESAFSAMANAAYAFAKTQKGTLTEKMQRLAESLEAVVEAWPNANMAAIAVLDSLVRQVDVPTAADSIWPVLMRLRSQ